jgi:hypothetical protein
VIKKTLATAAIAASAVGAAGAATPAMAFDGDDVSRTALSTYESSQANGTTTTGGMMSPNMSLTGDVANGICVPVHVPVDDIQACTEGSTAAGGGGLLAGAVSDLAALSPDVVPLGSVSEGSASED